MEPMTDDEKAVLLILLAPAIVLLVGLVVTFGMLAWTARSMYP